MCDQNCTVLGTLVCGYKTVPLGGEVGGGVLGGWLGVYVCPPPSVGSPSHILCHGDDKCC